MNFNKEELYIGPLSMNIEGQSVQGYFCIVCTLLACLMSMLYNLFINISDKTSYIRHEPRLIYICLRGLQGGEAGEDPVQDCGGPGRRGIHQRHTGVRLCFKVKYISHTNLFTRTVNILLFDQVF